MAIFEAGIVQTSSPGTISSICWNPSNTSAVTFGSLGSVPASAILKDVTVVNTGSVPVYVGSGSVVAGGSALTTMLQIPVGGQMTLQGYSGTVGTAGTLWANTAVINTTGALTVGMASVASVV